MSELAAAYYQERAESFGFPEFPSVLSGEPIPLSEFAGVMSVHNPDQKAVTVVTSRLQTALKDTEAFLRFCTPPLPDYPGSMSLAVVDRNRQFVDSAVDKLLIPKAINTGKIGSISLQALARAEVPDTALTRVKTGAYGSVDQAGDNGENTEVYFEISGQIKSGSREIKVGGLVVARSILMTERGYRNPDRNVNTILFSGKPLKKNEQLARNIQGESRAISTSVKAERMRKPFSG